MDSELTLFCKLAGWAAYHRCQEVYDACCEIFEKHSLEIEIASPLGIRLMIFELHKCLLSSNMEENGFIGTVEALHNMSSNSALSAKSKSFDPLRKLVPHQIVVCGLARSLGVHNIDALAKESEISTQLFSIKSFKSDISSFLNGTTLEEFGHQAVESILKEVSVSYNVKKAFAYALFQRNTLDKFRIEACQELLRIERTIFGSLDLYFESTFLNDNRVDAEEQWNTRERDEKGPYAPAAEEPTSNEPKKGGRGGKKNGPARVAPAPRTESPTTPPPTPSRPAVAAVAASSSKIAADIAAAQQTFKEKGDKIPTPVKDIRRSRRQLDDHTNFRDPLASALEQPNGKKKSTSRAASKSEIVVNESPQPQAKKRSREIDDLLASASTAMDKLPAKRGAREGISAPAPVPAPASAKTAAQTKSQTIKKSSSAPSPKKSPQATKKPAAKKIVEDTISTSTESTAAQHDDDLNDVEDEFDEDGTPVKSTMVSKVASGLQKMAADIAAVRFPPKLQKPGTPSKAIQQDTTSGDFVPRKKWTEEEETALMEGMARHGTNWAVILQDEDFAEILRHRSNVNLKDKARNLSKK